MENGTFTFNGNTLQYSLDDGATWNTLASNTASPTVTAGNKIMWKQTGLTATSSAGIGTFSSTSDFNVEGNIMSLYYGDNFSDQTDLTGKSYAFKRLFKECTSVISCDNLILPIVLEIQSYNEMFCNCSGLIVAP